MADKKISQLPQGNITPQTLFPIVTSGVTSQTTFQEIQNALSGETSTLEEVLTAGNVSTSGIGMLLLDEDSNVTAIRPASIQVISNVNINPHPETRMLPDAVIVQPGTNNNTQSSFNFNEINFNNRIDNFDEEIKIKFTPDLNITENIQTIFNIPNKGNGEFTLATLEDISGGTSYVELTKTELDTLITNNELIPNTLYKISGVHPSLYDDGNSTGTTIYLKALTTNKLATSGYGEFWNPKYDQEIENNGIYSKYSLVTLSNVVGEFFDGEPLNGNNGQIINFIHGEDLEFAMISGTDDGNVLTSVIGQYSNATANVSVITQEHSIGTKTIWGGYSWINNNGNNGSAIDNKNLSSDWTKNNYNDENYNLVLDIIEYDITIDNIIRRYDVIGNNDVRSSILNIDGISLFQFGNPMSSTSYGVYNNVIDVNSSVININFGGLLFANNKVISTNIIDNDFLNGSAVFNNQFNNSNISINFLYNATIAFNICNGNMYQNVLYSNSIGNKPNITGNVLKNNSGIHNNNLTIEGVSISNNELEDSAVIQNIEFINNGRIEYNYLDYQSILHNITINNSFIQNNKLFNSDISFSSELNKTLRYNTFKQINLSLDVNGLLLFNNLAKTIYQRPDGTPKIRYYNDSDIMVIADITD